jgi:hypothetical protein
VLRAAGMAGRMRVCILPPHRFSHVARQSELMAALWHKQRNFHSPRCA